MSERIEQGMRSKFSSFATAPLINFAKTIPKIVVKCKKSERQILWEQRQKVQRERIKCGLEEELEPDTGREDNKQTCSIWRPVL